MYTRKSGRKQQSKTDYKLTSGLLFKHPADLFSGIFFLPAKHTAYKILGIFKS
jgi:hypothetical protein